MARVSFTLRRPTTEADNVGGSFVRYDTDVYNNAASTGASPGAWLADIPAGTRDYDSALRADGFILPPNEVAVGFFEATAVCYGLINIRYGVPIDTSIDPTTSAAPVPFEAVVVSSPLRFPTSVEDGRIVSRSSIEVDDDFGGFTPGKWTYLTLFVHYKGTNDDYYSPLASLEVLVPKNYQSTLLLWERIPEHYRTQDELIGTVPNSFQNIVTPSGSVFAPSLGCSPTSESFGPLFRFLSIFGFEMDKTRTLLDYLMVAKDPAEANSYTLFADGWTIGMALPPQTINLQRYRTILENYGHLVREKGTVSGLKNFIKVFSNCDSDVDEAAHEITVYSQRVNYCYNPANGDNAVGASVSYRPAHEVEQVLPTFIQGTFDPTTFDSSDPNTYPIPLGGYEPGMYWLASASASTFDGASVPVAVDDYIVMYGDITAPQFAVRPQAFEATTYDSFDHLSLAGTTYTSSSPTNNVTHAWFRLPSPVPARAGDQVYVRVSSDETQSRMVVGGRLVKASDNSVVGEGGFGVDALYRYASIPVLDLPEDTWTVCFAEILVDFTTVSSFNLSSILIERNYLGPYFDGDKTTSTWVINPDGTPSGKDHRWSTLGGYNATSPSSGPGISVYTEEFFKTIPLLKEVFKDAIPAEEYGKYTFDEADPVAPMVYDGIPGLSAIDAYYDSITP